MPLKPEASLSVGLATAAVVFAIHSQATPSMADVRVGQPNDDHIDRSERAATWLSVAVVSGISLVAKDPAIFIIGGAATVAMAWWTRYGNQMNPLTGSASMEGMVQRFDLEPQPPDETAASNLDTDVDAGLYSVG
jgi:hypothetical protein